MPPASSGSPAAITVRRSDDRQDPARVYAALALVALPHVDDPETVERSFGPISSGW